MCIWPIIPRQNRLSGFVKAFVRTGVDCHGLKGQSGTLYALCGWKLVYLDLANTESAHFWECMHVASLLHSNINLHLFLLTATAVLLQEVLLWLFKHTKGQRKVVCGIISSCLWCVCVGVIVVLVFLPHSLHKGLHISQHHLSTVALATRKRQEREIWLT